MTSIFEQFRTILIEAPLYSVFLEKDFNVKLAGGNDFNAVSSLESKRIQFDCYCVGCEQDATFVRGGKGSRGAYETYIFSASDTFVIQMSCTRANHTYYIWIKKIEGGVQKIGMSPSMEDIANSDVKKFRSILNKSYLSDLHRAGGLASHGVGIGSFVYLRRIFEKQISDHYARRVEEKGAIEGFDDLRVAEKIKAIEEYLPRALVKHREIYSVLSKGIHELDEKTCLDFFPALRQGIVMILEQDFLKKEAEEAEKELEAKLSKLTYNLRQ